MKKIILASLLGTTLTSTSVFAMEEPGDEDPYKTHAHSVLELYEAGKIDTKKGLRRRLGGIWKPELEFLDTDKAELMTRDILFAILDKRKDFTFYRNGKCFQIANTNCSLRDEFPNFCSYLYLEPLSRKNPAKVGWYFAGMKYDASLLYFEIKELENSKTNTKKIAWGDYGNDFDDNLGIDNLWDNYITNSDDDLGIGNLTKKRF